MKIERCKLGLANRLKDTLARLNGDDIDKDRAFVNQELSQFLKLDLKVVEQLLPQGTYLSSDEWNKKVKDQSIDSLYGFYSSSETYLFDLCFSNYWSPSTYSGMTLIARNSHGRVLDYGGGVGSQLIAAWNAGLRDLTYYDIKGTCFSFAIHRFKNRSMNVKIIPASDSEDRLEGYYDTIYCREVLEHVKNPSYHIERLISHLAKNGRLFISYHPDKDENRPMHFNNDVDIKKWLEDRGYKLRSVSLFHIIPLRRINFYYR